MHKILVIGTGTIGGPLIGLLSDFCHITNTEIYFHKRTPLLDETAKVNRLISRGAKLVVDEKNEPAFKKLGHKVTIVGLENAIEQSDVVIDCTPAGNENKKLYRKWAHGPTAVSPNGIVRKFIAQGSEKGFGVPYAYGIVPYEKIKNNSFVQVVSCNTHNIAALINTLAPNSHQLLNGDFTCIRRANDISQDGGFVASPSVGEHSDERYGTHHAADVARLFGEDMRIFSSAMKLNTQYMHTIRFNLTLKRERGVNMQKKDVIQKLEDNPLIGLTHRTSANRVFSFGRNHGYYGRILNQTVVSLPTLHVSNGVFTNQASARVTGFCFTPQDGNSLLSSIAAALVTIKGEEYENYIKGVYLDMVFPTI